MLAKHYVDLSPTKLKQVYEQASLRVLSAGCSQQLLTVDGSASSPAYQSSNYDKNLSASLPAGGTYYLVYDNTFSLISQKNVQTTVSLTYTS